MSNKSLQDRLAELRAENCQQLPTPQMAVMSRATARLRRSGIMQHCLQPGETVPDFSFIDADNQPASLYQLLDSGPVLVNFFRGFWCAYCRTEFDAFTQISQALETRGCHYLAISPQHDDSSPRLAGFSHLYDRDNQIAAKFNIVYTLADEEVALFASWKLDLGVENQSAGYQLPLPATYLIDQDRTVAFQFVDVDFRSRCCPADIIEELDRLLRVRQV